MSSAGLSIALYLCNLRSAGQQIIQSFLSRPVTVSLWIAFNQVSHWKHFNICFLISLLPSLPLHPLKDYWLAFSRELITITDVITIRLIIFIADIPNGNGKMRNRGELKSMIWNKLSCKLIYIINRNNILPFIHTFKHRNSISPNPHDCYEWEMGWHERTTAIWIEENGWESFSYLFDKIACERKNKIDDQKFM